MKLTTANAGFVLHIAIEIPAAINFMLFPSKQLQIHTPHAHAVIRQYALLLLSSVLISMLFVSRPADDLSRFVAGSLAIYHIGPALRSCGRMSRQKAEAQPVFLSEAFLYLCCHFVTGVSLVLAFLEIKI